MNRICTPLMDEPAVRDLISRMATDLLARLGGDDGAVLLGIRRRGDHLADLLHEELASRGHDLAVGALDITFYRDDLATVGPRPVVGETHLPPEGIDDRVVVLVDDVLHTGRTIRAALNEITDWGRPSRTLLCVLVDRGGRQLPIQADVVGTTVQVSGPRNVEVSVPELDGRLALELVEVRHEDDG